MNAAIIAAAGLLAILALKASLVAVQHILNSAPTAAQGTHMSDARRAQRQLIANRVACRLKATEARIDEALHEIGLLCAELPQMRQEASLSAVFGQDLFQAAGSTYGALVDARSRGVQLHHAMDAARRELGLRPAAASGGDKPSDPNQDIAFGAAA